MKRGTATCLSSALLLVCGCQYNPHAHRFSKHQPDPGEAAGTYVLSEILVESVGQGLREKIGNYAATSRIVLRHDGTASFIRFPVFEKSGDFDYAYKGPEDFGGRWSIEATGTVSSGGDDLRTVYGIHFAFADGRELVESPTFTGSPKVDGMIFTFGDPDAGDIVGFKKQ